MDWKSGSALSSGDTTATVRSRFFDTITISGCGAVFEAMTCKQYLARSWGDLGIKVANMILEFISTTREDACISQSNDPHTKPVITHSEIDGKIGEALAYAFQSHLYLIHSGHITGLQASRLAEIIHSGTLSGGHEYAAFALSPLIPLQVDRASCWMSLFETGIVAETPVRRDVALEGLEMSFELMTSLAAVETYHYIQREGNATEFILLGFFTALIPTLLHDSGTISWHFEYSDTDVLRPMDLRSTQNPLTFIGTPADLAHRRCVVGMWPHANIMLGVEGTRLDFEDSGLPHRSSVLRLKGFEGTAALGVSGGPVQGILQATRTYEHHVTRQRFTRSTAYVRALDHLSQAVALVYDCKTHIGWLAPQTSLLLHLCHAYYARLSNIKGQTDPIPWAKPSTDGASAATAAFRGSGDIVVSEVGDQTDDQLLLRQLLVSLNSSLQVTQDTRQLPKKIFHWTKEVYFSELQDQILEPDDGSALRVLDPAEWPSIKAWLEITKKVDGLLVCRNLDQAIALVGPSCSPHNQSPQANTNIITNNMNSNNTTTTTTTTTQTQLSTHLATCSSCAKVPEGRGYLVAHAWCLQNVLKRPSPIASKNMATWIQNGKPFDVHLHASNESIWAHPEKVLQSFAKPERGLVCNKTGGHTVEGAVVFGKYGEESLGEWLRKVALSP
ncbi:hypothetical protein D6D13_03348 [Aureobasidium pullulans]|uniref:Uncharacterized protein n=1 Tax=Aureobasidium pullulans TaxID=5580 RepID=A0A4S9D4J2_AURPU|nr:hypothetical protein D6D13_03348 [Aureobasidium pullulans]